MNSLQRVVLGLLVVVVDAAVLFIPLGSLFVAYIVIVNPPWFRDFLARSAAPGA